MPIWWVHVGHIYFLSQVACFLCCIDNFVCLFGMQISILCIYFLMIGVISDGLQNKIPWMTQRVCVALILPFPLSLACLRSYRLIAKTAKWGVLGVLLALVVTTVDATYQWASGDLHVSIRNIKMFDLAGFPIFVGNASFYLSCILCCLTIFLFCFERNCVEMKFKKDIMQKKKKKKYCALFWSVIIVLVANTLFADYIYICWSEQQGSFPQNIVTALHEGVVQIFTKTFLSIDLLFTYAIIMYPFTEALELMLLKQENFGTKFCCFEIICLKIHNILDTLNYYREEEIKRNVLRTALVISTALVAMFIPHFGYLTGILWFFFFFFFVRPQKLRVLLPLLTRHRANGRNWIRYGWVHTSSSLYLEVGSTEIKQTGQISYLGRFGLWYLHVLSYSGFDFTRNVQRRLGYFYLIISLFFAFVSFFC
ncbi:hypothetical protein RFI_02725 [Reticulomyxa filosa]|uniref:Amino acid transporter transmembrane domain-containing protein n=1 Tax=Reticulomyxa filosa TaxID=46433 RepID=X6P9S4_RETFI|nr:hypothetical protein RFI_02725 [Reticulomyxa filosa]|eukprot:ETO34372.1 hypothetical protein RFI_02725 [Reticulomyxa filosa]